MNGSGNRNKVYLRIQVFKDAVQTLQLFGLFRKDVDAIAIGFVLG